MASTPAGKEIVVLDAQSGRRLRTLTATSLHLRNKPYDFPAALAYTGGRLIVGAIREVMAINPDTGSRYWSVPGGATELAVDGNTVYTAKYCQNECGAVVSEAIRVPDGRVLWKHSGFFGGVPVLAEGRLFQTIGRGVTQVYEPGSGSLVATLRYAAQWLGDSTAVYAYVPNGSPGPGAPRAGRAWLGRIGSTGKPMWKFDLGFTGTGNAVLASGMLYVPSNRFHPGVIGVKASNGHIQWGADVGKDVSLLAANRLVYVLHQPDARLSVLNGSSGATIQQLSIPRYGVQGTSTLVLGGGTLYAVEEGGIVAMRG
jgi:hypothetical protein